MVSALFLTPPIRKVADPIVRERNVSPSPIRIPWLTLRCRAWLCSVILLVGITQVKGHTAHRPHLHTPLHTTAHAPKMIAPFYALLRPSAPFYALLRPFRHSAPLLLTVVFRTPSLPHHSSSPPLL